MINKFYILQLIFFSLALSQGSFQKINGLNSEISLNEVKSYDIENSIANNEIFSSSTFYQIKDGVDIEVEFNFNKKTSTILNIEDTQKLIDSGYGLTGDNIFPASNLIVSEPMIFRGLVVRQITFIPFTYNFITISRDS